jgi:glycerol dehydrogenase
LPTTLGDIGLGNADRGKLLVAAAVACDPVQRMHHEAGEITSEKVLHAMLAADAIGHQRRSRAANIMH